LLSRYAKVFLSVAVARFHSDEGLELETSAFEFLQGREFLSLIVIIPSSPKISIPEGWGEVRGTFEGFV